jgi:cell division protein FtsQ
MSRKKRDKKKQKRNARAASGSRRGARRRKLRLWLLYSLLLLAVIATGVVLSLTVLFKIDIIEVTGESRYDPAEIIRASGIEEGQNLFLCKTREGQAAVEQAMPYIETAIITRKIPGTIQIAVTEAIPSGALESEGNYVVISGRGKILSVVESPPEDLPLIRGLKLKSTQPSAMVDYDDENTERILADITAAIQNNQMDKIREIDLTNLYSPQLDYEGRITIKLGIPSSYDVLDYRLRTAMKVLSGPGMKDTDRGVLDVSLADETDKSYFRPDYDIASSQTTGKSSAPGGEGSAPAV